MNDIDLKHIQQCELMIAKELKRICEKHDINYIMGYGTLLGAIRHKGFIPWDDDMDFAFLREEYDRLIEVCKTELDDKFFLQTWDTDPEYPHPYGKILLKNTYVEEYFSKNTKSIKGIFIDLFPLDLIPDDTDKQKKFIKNDFFFRRSLWMKKGHGKLILKQNLKQKLKYIFSRCLFALFPYNYLKPKYKNMLIQYNNEDNSLVYDFAVKHNDYYSRALLDNVTYYDFEDTQFPAPCKYDEYLTKLYGDYMKLPPVEERGKQHTLINYDFGKY